MARILGPTPKGQRSREGRFRSRAGRGGGPVHLSPGRGASACVCRLLRSRWLERLRYSVLPSASFAGWIGGRQPGARTLLRWGSYQPPIRSLLARRRLLAVVADLKATDQNKGTKPVFRGVNPVAATTAGIFAVFRMGRSISQTQNPAYVRSRPTFCIPWTTCCGRSL